MLNDKDKILDRIIKLFALADSSKNPSDAEVFAADKAAKKLMIENEISEADIKEKEGKNKESWNFSNSQAKTTSESKVRQWQGIIAVGLADLTLTRSIKTEEGVFFYGDEVDCGIASALFSLLLKIAIRNGDKFCYTKNKNSYLLGFACGIQSQCKKKATLTIEQENRYAIVSTEKKDWLSSKFKEVFPATVQSNTKIGIYNKDLYGKGFKDGISIDLTTSGKLGD